MTPVDVLAVGPHPDDVEVGCGGVLALAVQAGARVTIADLTRGELSTAGSPDQRRAEAARAAEILGADRLGLDLPDGRVGTEAHHRDAVVELLRRTRPSVVLAPYPHGDRHPDHAAAGRLVRDACFLAGVARFGEGAAHRPGHLYHYMVHHLFEPTFVVDVSRVWDRREAAIASYESQFSHRPGARVTAIGGIDFLELLADRSRVLGALVGAERGEAFHCEGPVGLSGLPGVGEPPGSGEIVYRSFL